MPNSLRVIENGAIAIHDSQIVDIGTYAAVRKWDNSEVRDVGEAVIMPGLVNAHTHLELTHHQNLLQRTPRFTDWLTQLIQTHQSDPERVNAAINDGIEMSLTGGATTVGDIHGVGKSPHIHRDSPIRAVVFFESTGFSPERTRIGIDRINEYLALSPQPDALFHPAVSPHAPYSTSERVYRHCLELARSRDSPLCTHLSETKDELEFLESGTGAFADLLNAYGISMSGWTPPKCSPVQYLAQIGILAYRPLLAHCNYLTDADIESVAESGASVAFCPRAHHYFHHSAHPIWRLIRAGVNVAIGTDSLASNWTLSMLDELMYLSKTQASLSPETIIDLATINGARALSLDRVGKLENGWYADVIGIAIPDNGQPVVQQILDESAQNILTVVAGRVCFEEDS
ncbi:MAG: amidohydrolase family protein [Candidatus Poribacteria bacterium]|nr:amidohydrolase family protein [Candidatus Poribacteria bacterium]